MADRFCGNCGQQIGEPIPHVRDLLFEVADEFLKFDSRLLRTAGTLLKEPGKLTLEYAKGKKADYITPFKLYFGCSFIFYLVAPVSGWMDPARFDLKIKDPAIFAGATQGLDFYYSHLATSSIFCLPICALVPALLYRKLRRPFMYHLVGTLHIWSGSFLIAAPIMLLSALVRKLTNADTAQVVTSSMFFISGGAYQVAAYRRMYGSSLWISILKTMAMFVFASLLGGVLLVSSVTYFVKQELKKVRPAVSSVQTPKNPPQKEAR